MARLIGQKAMNTVVSHQQGVVDHVHDVAVKHKRLAKANLDEARASTRWHKIFGPGHLTEVDVTDGSVDSFVNLRAPNPMAIEYGHQPSGVFGPGGRYGHLDTKAPDGLYILTRAMIG